MWNTVFSLQYTSVVSTDFKTLPCSYSPPPLGQLKSTFLLGLACQSFLKKKNKNQNKQTKKPEQQHCPSGPISLLCGYGDCTLSCACNIAFCFLKYVFELKHVIRQSWWTWVPCPPHYLLLWQLLWPKQLTSAASNIFTFRKLMTMLTTSGQGSRSWQPTIGDVFSLKNPFQLLQVSQFPIYWMYALFL